MNLRLKRMRELKGLTQQEAADALGVKVATYRTWEQASVKITLENTCRCAALLDCSPNDICGWYDEHPEDRPAPPGDPMAADLVDAYGRCTPERRAALVQSARDAALASGEAPQRPSLRSREAV